jgi:hypothetical protein
VARHHYSLGQVILTLLLVLKANISLQAVARAMSILNEPFDDSIATPHWSTGRWWLLRVGYYLLHRVKQLADDWVLFIDHSTQLGQERTLLILGIRLRNLPPSGQSLSLADMEVIDLVPVVKSDKRVVCEQLKAAAAKTGVPRAIVHDCGGDLAGGLALFQEEHPTTAGIYDITHKAACLLKARLEKDPTWKAFSTEVSQTKFETQQTELASLVPPSQRVKARFMNLGDLIRWGWETLTVIEELPPVVLSLMTPERLEEKFGWLRGYKEPMRDWSEMQQVIDVTEDFVRRNGHYCGSANDLKQRFEPLSLGAPAQDLRDELVNFVDGESQKAKKGEHLPGSSEVLESAFGKFKEIEGNQSKRGFTGLLLALPTIFGQLTPDTVREALESVKTQCVVQWIRDHLGQTQHSKRCMVYSAVRPPSQRCQGTSFEPVPCAALGSIESTDPAGKLQRGPAAARDAGAQKVGENQCRR